MFGLQPWHMIVVAAVALIIFGPSRLPEVGKAIGKTLREFREAATTAEDGIKQGLEDKPKPQTIVPPLEQAKPYLPSEPDKPNL